MPKDVLFAAETRGDSRGARFFALRVSRLSTNEIGTLLAVRSRGSAGQEPFYLAPSPLVPRSLPPGFQLCQIDCRHRLALVGQFVA